jgi:D-alanyl-D-alanine carboxypeptidase
MVTLASATIRDFPQFYLWYSQKEFTYHGIKQHNRNKILWSDHTVDGLKTGFTKRAGYNLVASALKPTLICVLDEPEIGIFLLILLISVASKKRKP